MRIGPLVAGAAAWIATSVASAQPDADTTRACLEAHVSVQERRLAGDLVGAATAAQICSAEGCPSLPKQECARWAVDVDRDTPRLALSVRGLGPGEKVRLRIDGELVEWQDEVRVNPGDHSIEIEAAGRKLRRAAHLVAGEREAVLFDPQAEDGGAGGGPSQPTGGTFPLGPTLLGAAGLAGLAVFGVAAGLGVAEYGELEGSCAPRCSPEQTAGVDEKLLVADVALGIGSGLLVAGGIWLIVELAAPDQSAIEVGRAGLAIEF